MVDKLYVKTILQIILFSLNTLLALIYSILILFIRRNHHKNNIFILNICLNIIGTCVYFIIFYILLYFNPQKLFISNMCNFLLYAYNVTSIEIPFAFVAFSAHRLCTVLYHRKAFFKTKKWIGICISSQWICVFVLSLPYVFRTERVSFVFLFFFPLINNMYNYSGVLWNDG